MNSYIELSMIITNFDIPENRRFIEITHRDHIIDAISRNQSSRINSIRFIRRKNECFSIQMRLTEIRFRVTSTTSPAIGYPTPHSNHTGLP